MSRHLPDRWLEYSRLGERIPNTPFICCKTPLSHNFHKAVLNDGNRTREVGVLEVHQQFTPQHLVDAVKEKELELQLVVDMTNTQRYYDGKVCFTVKHDIEYVKLKCEGQKIPNQHVMAEFFDIMHAFMLDNGEALNNIVAVHCTHGVNRTGYVVCRFMVERLGFAVDDAINVFNQARGHLLERKEYIDDLKDRFKPLPRMLPPLEQRVPPKALMDKQFKQDKVVESNFLDFQAVPNESGPNHKGPCPDGPGVPVNGPRPAAPRPLLNGPRPIIPGAPFNGGRPVAPGTPFQGNGQMKGREEWHQDDGCGGVPSGPRPFAPNFRMQRPCGARGLPRFRGRGRPPYRGSPYAGGSYGRGFIW